ncbi:ankyrin repeat protein [Akanthomyces lecanii RCEF 1005]|uniref:Ankyrin repeat protein n=1 Tax=Akanthomyces lecanii RCEF 1005 TaxID=1081108 RepID=A0A162KGG0_CORDF|nr:ankyrin repeat protein [Akanthomyces lecanii RCEF 1005]
MDVTVQLPTDPVERRRVQNRIAQRKFRHKRLQNQASSSTPNRRSSAGHSRRPSSSNTVEQATFTPLVSGAPPSPSLFGCIDTRVGPDGLPTTPATVSIDDFAFDVYFDGSFDSYYDIPSLPTELPSQSLSCDQSFSAPTVVRTSYPGLPTPQATVLASYASSSSSSGRSHGTPVGEGSASASSIDSVSRPGSQRRATLDAQATNIDTSPRMEIAGEAQTSVSDGNGAKCDKGWMSTIHIAVQSGNERILGMLLRQDTEGINCPDSNGRTPLFHGAIQDNEPVVQMLLSHGARIGLLDKEGRSPLHWAVLYRRLEVLRTLLEHWNKNERNNFDIDAHDNVGWTPLHLAVERRFEAGVLLLMQNGANIKARAKLCPHTGKPIPFNVEPL